MCLNSLRSTDQSADIYIGHNGLVRPYQKPVTGLMFETVTYTYVCTVQNQTFKKSAIAKKSIDCPRDLFRWLNKLILLFELLNYCTFTKGLSN
jgi:hypothetical protein